MLERIGFGVRVMAFASGMEVVFLDGGFQDVPRYVIPQLPTLFLVLHLMYLFP